MASPVTVAKNKHITDGFTEVVERGRGWLKSRKPGTNQYALTTQVGNIGWHRGTGPFTETDEIDTAWQVTTGTWDYEMTQADYQAYIDTTGNYRYEDYLTGEYVDLNVTFFGWTNDEGASQAISFNPVTPSVSGDVLTWDELFGTGTALRVQTQTARLAKFLDVANLTDLPAPIIGGTNIQLTFSYQMIRSSGLDVYVDGAKWNDNSTITTANHVEFRQKSTGNPVWWFKVPFAHDSDKGNVFGSQTLKKAGANLFVDGHIPYSWISAATFPITIDPTIDEIVGASSDDAHQLYGTTAVNLTNSTIELWDFGYTHIGLRFTTIGLDGSETINSDTYISLYPSEYIDLDSTVYGEYTGDAATFTTANNNISGRTPTTATVAWTETLTDAQYNDSPDISGIIDEIINHGSWAEDNDIAIILSDDGASDFAALSYDYDSGTAPTLHIDYTAGGAATLEPSASDSLTVGEAVSVTPLVLENIDIDDGLTVADTPTVNLIAPIDFEISVDDGFILGESVEITPLVLENISIEDGTTIGESVSITPLLLEDLTISDSDTIEVGELASVGPLLLEIDVDV